MLCLFHPAVAVPPEEITAAEDENAGQTDSGSILKAYRKDHPTAICIEFGKRCAMAYSHDNQELLRPRCLAVADDIFCMFVGTLENLAHLRQQYGINKFVTEVTLVIEIYRAMRDRSPYPSDHVMRGLNGSFSFVLFDNTTETIFVAVDAHGKVPFYWATATDGSLAFSDDAPLLKAKCGKTFSSFPAGCFFSSANGIQSYEHPTTPVTAVPRVDSQGQVSGVTFHVDPSQEEQKPAPGGLGSNSFHRVGSDAWDV